MSGDFDGEDASSVDVRMSGGPENMKRTLADTMAEEAVNNILPGILRDATNSIRGEGPNRLDRMIRQAVSQQGVHSDIASLLATSAADGAATSQ
jgi:hypothetical protein